MEDIIKSIKAFLYDRSSSPLFGAFIISWMAWNYRLLMLVLSDTEIDKKFKDIDKYFDPVVWEIGKYSFSIPTEILNGIIVPVIFALTYIFLYPFAAKPVYRYSLKKQSEIREIKQEENDLRLLDAKESRELLQRMAELQDKYNIDTENLQRQVSSLSKTISELEKKIRPDLSDLTDEQLQEKIDSHTESEAPALNGSVTDKATASFNKTQISLLRELAKAKDAGISYVNEGDLANQLNIKPTILEHEIKRLVESQYAHDHLRVGGPKAYSISTKGIEYLISEHLVE